MSIRQYIGARYVPKFFENSATGDATWAPNTPYEPLIMVSWNNYTYTSKKAVPANIGNPANNPDYWAVTSLSSAQVTALAEQVNEIASDLEDESGRIDGLYGYFTNGVLQVSHGGTGGNASLLTTTYTEQEYVTESNFGTGFHAFQYGKLVLLFVNVVFASLPTANFEIIGKIEVATSLKNTAIVNLFIGQTHEAAIQVRNDGTIAVYGNDSAGGRVRDIIPFFLS